jgi:hypothetical protein
MLVDHPLPPTTRRLPSARRTAAGFKRGSGGTDKGVHVPVAGS